jgi:hypothetical protein
LVENAPLRNAIILLNDYEKHLEKNSGLMLYGMKVIIANLFDTHIDEIKQLMESERIKENKE